MFIYSTLLWGLVLIGLPILIHLINLMRHRRIKWAAMEFLRAAYKKRQTSVRLKELLLLLMRMAAVALIVLMIAQPTLKQNLGFLPGGKRIHHIVLLDDSYSMADRVKQDSAFATAEKTVGILVDELLRSSAAQKFTMVRTSRALGDELRPDFQAESMDTDFAGRIGLVLKEAKQTQSTATVLSALEAMDKMIPETADESRILYIVSDFRQPDWNGSPELAERLKKIADRNIAIQLIDCTESGHHNLTISGLQLTDGTISAGIPLTLKATVANRSEIVERNIVVQPELRTPTGKQLLTAVTIDQIEPGRAVEKTFTVQFPAAGNYFVSARLQTDAIEPDNESLLTVNVPENETVLIIDDDLNGANSFALATALAPGGNVQTGISARIEQSRFLSSHPLDGFSAIFLTNVAGLDPAQNAAIEQYVRKGGGVGCFLGDKTNPAAFGTAYSGGAGWFPVELDASVELPVDYLENANDLRVSAHSIFRLFQGKSASLLKSIKINRYFKIRSEIASDRVLATLRNNDPLVVEKDYGAGRVVALLTSSDASWNNWMKGNPSYVVTMLQLQTYLARTQHVQESWIVGSPLKYAFPAEEYSPETQFLTFNGDLLETAVGEKPTVDEGTKPDGSAGNGSADNGAESNGSESGSAEGKTTVSSDASKNPGTAGASETSEIAGTTTGTGADAAKEQIDKTATLPEESLVGKLVVKSKPILEKGFYAVELNSANERKFRKYFAVNVDPKEGAIARMSQQQLADFLKEAPFTYTPANEFHYRDDSQAGFHLSDFILYVLLLWLFGEMLLATNVSYHMRDYGVSK